ncbi:MAG: hypothetical protein JOZ32_03555 [Bryobacterales bacterium]|nr:hypothetical protein [Bryobacterales bacterium]
MRSKFVGILAVGVGLLLGGVPIFAHHSFSAEFDVNKPVTLKGAVTKVEWTNPHVWIYIDVTNDNGTVEHWQCENGAPNALARMGWTRNSLKVGDTITIQGFRAKNAENTANARQVTLADGRKVFSGSAEDGGPGKAKDSGQ